MTYAVSLRSFYVFKEGVFVCRIEDEAQRYGRNKDTIVNSTYINSGEYRRKFDSISDIPKLNRLLYQLAKKMLIHRSGTVYEDMYWIDLNTLKIIAEETIYNFENQIVYSTKTKEKIVKYDNLLTIHSHPNSFPPSDADLYSNYLYGYSVGIVVCHDGKVYKYTVGEWLPMGCYDVAVAKYIKRGYNSHEAQMKALEDMQKMYKLEFEEVVNHGM